MTHSDLYSQIDKNKRETLIIFLLFTFLFSLFFYSLGYLFGDPSASYFYLFLGILISLFSVLYSYYFSDKVILKISKAKPAQGPQFKMLNNLVENISLVAGIPKPKVYYIEDSAPNAFATGRNPKHSAVVVTTGLLKKLNRVELEGVIAHELAHIKNYDILVASIVAVLVGSITLVADLLLRSRLNISYNKRVNNKSNSNSNIFLFIALLALIISPIIAKIIQLSLSRNREFLADATGAYFTRYPKGLANALLKISQDKEVLEVSNKATAHLYIVNPFKGPMAKRLANLFNTHPPIEERVKRLLSM